MAGKHELTRNEIEQVGFRLASELGHKTVYPVDWAGADLVADWFRRSIRIYSNATRLADSPNEASATSAQPRR